MPEPRRVMVGTDRSETAERAVRWAARFADRFGADLHVVQVITPLSSPEMGQSGPEPAVAQDLVQHVRSIAGDRGRGRVIIDEDPAMALVRAAEEDAIDVLIVGNAGMAGRNEFLLGNVPNRISHNARCTVILVNTIQSPANGTSESGVSRRSQAEEEYGRPHRIARGAQIAAVFAKHGLREVLGFADEEGAVGHRRQAKRLRSALEELGPTFAKIGQLLASRPDLLPPEYIDELVQLRDRVTPLTEEQVVHVMEQDLGVPWEDVFQTIEREPLAAGTIAQVHRASLASGEKVVVKIQRPDARELITEDLALLKLFAERAGTRPLVRRFIDMPAVFEHLSVSLNRELDFRLEAANAERMRGALAGFPRLAVPCIHPNYSTARLLVMQDVGGVPVMNIPAGALRKEIATQLIESFCSQILVDGFFHADPHPGNMMWQVQEQRLYFLDLGMVGELGGEMRELMILLLTAFWQKDADFLTEVILMLSGTTDRTELEIEAFRREIQALLAKHRNASIRNIQFVPVLQEIIEISYRNRVPLPASLTLTAKTLAEMQQVASQLDSEIDPFDVAGRFLMRTLARRVVAKTNARTLFYQSRKIKIRVMRVLEGFERLVGARAGQKLEVNFRATSLEGTIRRAGRRLALGVTAGFAVLASALSEMSARASGWMPVTFGIAGVAFMVALVVDLLSNSEPRGQNPTKAPEAS